jgi:glucose-1-phosphate cytidylyltransferase
MRTGMKAVILAGGMGTRISEESHLRPKPMIEIGGRPILWHIMKIYSHFGIDDFVICLGYKGYVIKEYFSNYFLHNSDVTIDARDNRVAFHTSNAEPWRITLIDTGETAMTGGRLKRVAAYLAPGEAFCFSYGDGLANVDITALIAFHQKHGRKATVTAVVPPGRYGALSLAGDRVERFIEKPPGDQAFINGGFFVLEPSVIDYIEGADTPWEAAPLERLAAEGELMAFRHTGFWQPMDTMREKNQLEALWAGGKAPWKLWA